MRLVLLLCLLAAGGACASWDAVWPLRWFTAGPFSIGASFLST